MDKKPKWATRFLSWYCRPELLEDLQGDLNEYFERNLRTKGLLRAKLIYILDVFKFFRPYTIRKPSPKRNLMLASYVKTSGRVILRNKLFSGINIFGMAVSMSVGLLVIAVLTDLYSYDRDLKDKDRLYRVVTELRATGQPPMLGATTSWRSGNLIRQEVPGIESMTILLREFGGDAKAGGITVPLSGMYADTGFLDVFSFPLVKGVATTALKEPHSMVLTETTAKKMFGNTDPMGKVVKIDTVNYIVTGLLKDIPKFSHIRFEALASLSSIDVSQKNGPDGDYLTWDNVFSNYVYVKVARNGNPKTIALALDKLSERENATSKERKVFLSLQPVTHIVISNSRFNEIGINFDPIAIYTLCGLAFIIILSACFNYTNLSMASSLRRSKEVGIRKVAGAMRRQVMGQFITESVLISLLSLCIAFIIFLLLRGQFLSFHEILQKSFDLRLSPELLGYFIALGFAVGLVAGILPALFYSKINVAKVLKGASSLKVFRHIGIRKALIVTQYTFSLIFITATVIGYHQYKSFLQFDLGFSTENILNIDMQGNKDEVFIRELSALPQVKGISRSLIVSSLGSIYGSRVKYKDPSDSDGVDLNDVDEHYLPMHQYTFLAGRNFIPKSKEATQTETVVNQTLIARFNIGHDDPAKAIGEVITVDDKKLTIVGVLKDFHYGTLERKIKPTAMRYSPDPGANVNVKIITPDIPGTMTSIETLWKQLDPVHPLKAEFYDDQIEEAYSAITVMLKIIGFFTLLAVCISSLGLFGMVLYTMEKRMKEVSIRKILGASESMLLYLLSKGFLLLLGISALIAIPGTVLFMDRVVLSNIAYHQRIGFGDVFIGLFIVGGVAILMIGLQTLRIVRTNPAKVLKNE